MENKNNIIYSNKLGEILQNIEKREKEKLKAKTKYESEDYIRIKNISNITKRIIKNNIKNKEERHLITINSDKKTISIFKEDENNNKVNITGEYIGEDALEVRLEGTHILKEILDKNIKKKDKYILMSKKKILEELEELEEETERKIMFTESQLLSTKAEKTLILIKFVFQRLNISFDLPPNEIYKKIKEIFVEGKNEEYNRKIKPEVEGILNKSGLNPNLIKNVKNEINSLSFFKALYDTDFIDFSKKIQNLDIDEKVKIQIKALNKMIQNRELFSQKEQLKLKKYIIKMGSDFSVERLNELEKEIDIKIKEKEELLEGEEYFNDIKNLEAKYLDEKIIKLIKIESIEETQSKDKKILKIKKSMIENRVEEILLNIRKDNYGKNFTNYSKILKILTRDKKLKKEFEANIIQIKEKQIKNGSEFLYEIIKEENLFEYLTKGKDNKRILFDKIKVYFKDKENKEHINEEVFDKIYKVITSEQFIKEKDDFYYKSELIKKEISDNNIKDEDIERILLNKNITLKEQETELYRVLKKTEKYNVLKEINKILSKNNFEKIELTEEQKEQKYIENITETLKSKKQRKFEIINMLFYKIASTKTFMEKFETLSKKEKFSNIPTIKIFEETIKETYPDIYQLLQDKKYNFEELKTEFQGIDFALYKNKKLNEVGYDLLIKELRGENFQRIYENVSRTEGATRINKKLFEALKLSNNELLEKLNLKEDRDLDRFIKNNYDFNYFRMIRYKNDPSKNIDKINNNIKIINRLIEEEEFQEIIMDYTYKNNLEEKEGEEVIRITYILLNNNNNNVLNKIKPEITQEEREFIKENSEKINKILQNGKYKEENITITIEDIQEKLKYNSITSLNDFEFFYKQENKINENFILYLNKKEQIIKEYLFYKDFLKSLKEEEVLEENEIEKLENHLNKIGKIEPSEINQNEIIYSFESFLQNPENKKIEEKFKEYKEKRELTSTASFEKRIFDLKELITSPKKKLNISFDIDLKELTEKSKKELSRIIKKKEKMKIFTDSFEQEVGQLDNDLNKIRVNFKLEFYLKNLQKVIEEENSEIALITFALSNGKSKSEVEEVFNENIKYFKELYKKLKAAKSRRNIENLEQELKVFAVSEEGKPTAASRLDNFLDNINYHKDISNIYGNIEELEENLEGENFNLLRQLNDFQDIFKIIEEREGKDLTKENKTALLKEIEEKFAEGYEKDKLISLLKDNEQKFISAIIEYKNKIYNIQSFVSMTLDYLKSNKLDTLKTYNYIKNIENEFSNEDLIEILITLQDKKTISAKDAEEVYKIFNLDKNYIKETDNRTFKEKRKDERLTKEQKLEKLNQKIEIIGTEPSYDKELKWGKASNILFEESFENISNDFIEFLEINAPKVKEELLSGKINSYTKKLDFDVEDNIELNGSYLLRDGKNLKNLIRVFMAKKIMKNYPNNNFSFFEIEEMLFLNQKGSPFNSTIMNKAALTMMDGFKVEYMKKQNDKEIQKLKEERRELLKLNKNTTMQKELDKEEKEKLEKEFEKANKEYIEAKNKIEEMKLTAKLSGVEIDESILKRANEEFEKLKLKKESKESNLNNLKQKMNRRENSKPNQIKRLVEITELLDRKNAQNENSEKLKKATLAQRLYINDEKTTLSDEKVLNSTPEEMRDTFKNDYLKNNLPLNISERMKTFNEQEKLKEDKLTMKEWINRSVKKTKRKLLIEDPYRDLSTQMSKIGYTKLALRDMPLHYGKIIGGGVNNVTKFFGLNSLAKLALKDMAKSMWLGHSKDAEAGMGKILGTDLSVKIPSLSEAMMSIRDKILLKEYREKRKKEQSEAPQKIQESLDEILKEIKHSVNPNKELEKALKHPLVADIMDPTKQNRLKYLKVDNSIFDKFRENMYIQMNKNMKYNVDSTNQKSAFIKMIKTMKIDKKIAKQILDPNFDETNIKGVGTNMGDELKKFIRIMKYGERYNYKKADLKEEEVSNAYIYFEKYLKEYVGGYIPKKEKEKKEINIFKKTLEINEKLETLQKKLNDDILSDLLDEIEDIIVSNQNENMNGFKNNIKTIKEIHKIIIDKIEKIEKGIEDRLLKEVSKNIILIQKMANEELSEDENKELEEYYTLTKKLKAIKEIKPDINSFRADIFSYVKEIKNIQETEEGLNKNLEIMEEISDKKKIIKLNKEEEDKKVKELGRVFEEIELFLKEPENNKNKDLCKFLEKYKKEEPEKYEKLKEIMTNENGNLEEKLEEMLKFIKNIEEDSLILDTNPTKKLLVKAKGNIEKIKELKKQNKELEKYIENREDELNTFLSDTDLQKSEISDKYKMIMDETFREEFIKLIEKEETEENMIEQYRKHVKLRKENKDNVEKIIPLYKADIKKVNENNIINCLDLLSVSLNILSNSDNKKIEKEELIKFIKNLNAKIVKESLIKGNEKLSEKLHIIVQKGITKETISEFKKEFKKIIKEYNNNYGRKNNDFIEQKEKVEQIAKEIPNSVSKFMGAIGASSLFKSFKEGLSPEEAVENIVGKKKKEAKKNISNQKTKNGEMNK